MQSGKRAGFFEKMSYTNAIIIANVVIFAIFYVVLALETSGGVSVEDSSVLKYAALNPENFSKGYFWTLLTSMFLHGSPGHLFVNMVSMFFIGNFVERLIGKKRFVKFYLISGLVAGLVFVAMAYFGTLLPGDIGKNIFGSVDDSAVGASGALFGLGGLLAVLIPRLPVLVFFVLPMPMWLAMAVLMFGLWLLSIFGGLPIGNTAHFGGLIVGLIYGAYLRMKYATKIRMLNKAFVR